MREAREVKRNSSSEAQGVTGTGFEQYQSPRLSKVLVSDVQRKIEKKKKRNGT